MGHNYAKPITPGMRLERLFKRIPSEWAVTLKRSENELKWQAFVHAPSAECTPSASFDDPADALQDGWRKNRSAQSQ